MTSTNLSVASWNMNHWQGSRATPDHNGLVWSYLAEHDVDVVLAQEAVPPSDPASWTHSVPGSSWTIDERRPWGSGIATRGLEMDEVRSTYTT